MQRRRGEGYKHLAIRGFEALAVEALRELQAEVEQLRARVFVLEGQLAVGVQLGYPAAVWACQVRGRHCGRIYRYQIPDEMEGVRLCVTRWRSGSKS